jgi:hypothetical protein
LCKAKRDTSHFLLTSDEFWFFYDTRHQKLWILLDVETPEVARRLIDTSKLIVPIFWNVSGIQVIDYVSSRESFNSTYFIERILPSIAGLPARHDAVGQKNPFVLRLDNLPRHKSNAILDEMVNMPVQLAYHSPDLPDLPPSDFF